MARSGRLPECVAPLQAALELEPKSFQALSWLSIAFRRLGRIAEAVDAARKALDLHPQDPEAFNNLGQCLLAQGDLAEACSALETAARLNPSSFPIQANLALAYAQSDNEPDATATFRRAMAMAPRIVPLRLSFAKFLLSKSRSAETARVLGETLTFEPNSAELHHLMARALLAEPSGPGADSNAARAEYHLRKSVALDPNSGPACGMLGFRLQSIGRFEEAQPFLERAVALEPRQGIAYCGISMAKKFSVNDGPLIDQLEDVLSGGGLEGKELSYLHYALGKARDDLGDYEAAIRHFDQANAVAYQAVFAHRPFNREEYAATTSAIKRLFSKEMLSQCRCAQIDGPEPIFVLGVMRSGTTLVEQILSSHPDIAAGGELEFWVRQGAAALRSSKGAIDQEAVQSLAARYAETLRPLAGNSPWITDKMPQNYQTLGLIHLACGGSPIVYVKRCGLDTCLSIWTTPYEVPPDFVLDKGNIMFMYDQHLELMDHWRTALPAGRFLEVQYEDLVANREAEIRRILDYCGIEWDDRCLHHELNPRPIYTASYWQARQPVYTGSVNRWKRYEPWLGDFRRLIPAAG